jgi:hypothetical protein
MTGVGATATSCMVNGHVGFFNRAWRSSSNFCFRSVSSCAGHASFRGRHSGESRSCHKHWSDRVGVPCFQTRYDAQQNLRLCPGSLVRTNAFGEEIQGGKVGSGHERAGWTQCPISGRKIGP